MNPDVKYEVQYSSYVNVTPDGFVILKRGVKTESFALQVTYSLSLTGSLFPLPDFNAVVIPAAPGSGCNNRRVWNYSTRCSGHTW